MTAEWIIQVAALTAVTLALGMLGVYLLQLRILSRLRELQSQLEANSPGTSQAISPESPNSAATTGGRQETPFPAG